jgi:hypothetical protein
LDAEFGYIPRNPEATVLYSVIAQQLETFLLRQQQRGRPIPGFVEEEFRSFLTCGVAEFGFLRLHCDACGKDRILPYSCKGRAWCPSCGGRRMADTAAYLVDRVIPDVPVRQWVLSLPFPVRYRVAFDTELLGKVLGVFIRAVFSSLKRRARDNGITEGKCGAVTFIQRFGSALNLTPHFHVLVFDGVFAAADNEPPCFYPLRAPQKREAVEVATRVATRVATLLESRNDESMEQDDSGLVAMRGASILGRISEGPNAGQRVKSSGNFTGEKNAEGSFEAGGLRCAMVSGFSVHAGVGIRAGQRKELERLCRYAARPPVANGRLSRLPDGRLSYRLKTPWQNGTTHVIFEPLELLEKLAVLVPVPRANLIHYHGVIAAAAKWRGAIVPAPPSIDCTVRKCECEDGGKIRKQRRRNYAWASLMARVFELDVLECSHCKGRLRILAAIHPPATRKILDCLGLPTRGPPLHSAIPESVPDSF